MIAFLAHLMIASVQALAHVTGSLAKRLEESAAPAGWFGGDVGSAVYFGAPASDLLIAQPSDADPATGGPAH